MKPKGYPNALTREGREHCRKLLEYSIKRPWVLTVTAQRSSNREFSICAAKGDGGWDDVTKVIRVIEGAAEASLVIAAVNNLEALIARVEELEDVKVQESRVQCL